MRKFPYLPALRQLLSLTLPRWRRLGRHFLFPPLLAPTYLAAAAAVPPPCTLVLNLLGCRRRGRHLHPSSTCCSSSSYSCCRRCCYLCSSAPSTPGTVDDRMQCGGATGPARARRDFRCGADDHLSLLVLILLYVFSSRSVSPPSRRHNFLVTWALGNLDLVPGAMLFFQPGQFFLKLPRPATPNSRPSICLMRPRDLRASVSSESPVSSKVRESSDNAFYSPIRFDVPHHNASRTGALHKNTPVFGTRDAKLLQVAPASARDWGLLGGFLGPSWRLSWIVAEAI